MNYQQSQQDMRNAYASGATGALASGLIWTLAGVAGLFVSQTASMLTLFWRDVDFPAISITLKAAKAQW